MNDCNWTLREHPERPCRFPSGPLLRTFEDLDDPGGRPDEALPLARARVLLADVPLLRHDFPELRDEDVVPWLLARAAVVSREQTRHLLVNTPIPIGDGPVAAFRPTRYGRSLVCAAGSSGTGAALLDVKGAGVAPATAPRLTLHGTGLMSLGEALQDAMMQWLVEAIFRHAGSSFAAVPLYAVLDAGFDVFSPEGRLLPAGLQVRRAHRRPHQAVEQPVPGSIEERLKAEVEMLLRHYGVTSTNDQTCFELRHHDGLELHYGGSAMPLDEAEQAMIRALARVPEGWTGRAFFDGINVQLAREVAASPSTAQLVDFGQYSVRSGFDLPVVNLVRGRPAMWGGVIHRQDADFVQPHPDLALPFDEWPPGSAWHVAEAYRAGHLTPEDVRRRADRVVAQVVLKWGIA